MKKHGASHGIAVLVCTVSSALLIDILRKYVPFVYNAVNKFSDFLINILGLSFAPKYVSIVLYASILAIFWGVGFALIHKD